MNAVGKFWKKESNKPEVTDVEALMREVLGLSNLPGGTATPTIRTEADREQEIRNYLSQYVGNTKG